MTALRVVRAGPRTTVQDEGRYHLAQLGVPVAGAVDRPAMHRVNAVVGNDPDAAVIESTLGDDEFEADGEVEVALGGAVPAEFIRLRAGERLRVSRATTGVYVYVAVAGGVQVAAVLGSRSRDTLSGLGPPLLRAGDVLPVGAGLARSAVAVQPHVLGLGGGPIAVFPGPHLDLLPAAAFASFVAGEWTVTPAADRVALRLSGPVIESGIGGIDSEGLVPGAVQLLPDGQPVVFLANHPVTGGYPVIAVVAHAELSRVAQARPGANLRFQPWS